MTFPRTLVLGAGWLGSALVPEFPQAVGTTRTVRAPHLRFVLEDRATWDSLPPADAVVWTFPVLDLAAARALKTRFPHAHHVLLGTTGCLVGEGPAWLTESAAVDATPRTQNEAALVGEGAELLRLAGLWGPARFPWAWVQQGRIKDANKWVNLVHQDDVVAAIRCALEHPQPGTVTHVCSGHPVTWGALCSAFVEQGLLAAGTEIPEGPGGGKKLSNQRLRQRLPGHAFRLPMPAQSAALLAVWPMWDEHLNALHTLTREPAEDWATDPDRVDRAAFHIIQLMTLAMDVVTAVAAHQDLPNPMSGTQMLETCHTLGLVDAHALSTLRPWAAVQRGDADGYTGITVESLHDAVVNGLSAAQGLGQNMRAYWGTFTG